MLTSSVVDRGFIGGVMVSMLTSSVVDRGFIGGVMVSVLASSVVDRGFIGGVNLPFIILSYFIWMLLLETEKIIIINNSKKCNLNTNIQFFSLRFMVF
jgi:hypothetical protein